MVIQSSCCSSKTISERGKEAVMECRDQLQQEEASKSQEQPVYKTSAVYVRQVLFIGVFYCSKMLRSLNPSLRVRFLLHETCDHSEEKTDSDGYLLFECGCLLKIPKRLYKVRSHFAVACTAWCFRMAAERQQQRKSIHPLRRFFNSA